MCRLIHCNKYTSLVGDTDNGDYPRQACHTGAGCILRNLYLLLNFAINLKLLPPPNSLNFKKSNTLIFLLQKVRIIKNVKSHQISLKVKFCHQMSLTQTLGKTTSGSHRSLQFGDADKGIGPAVLFLLCTRREVCVWGEGGGGSVL